MVDVTRLIPDVRAVDIVTVIECKAVIQSDVFSQHSVDKDAIAALFRRIKREINVTMSILSPVFVTWYQFADILYIQREQRHTKGE